MTRNRKIVLALASFACLASSAAFAGADNDRLLIVNGNTGRVVYDDGRDDLFCVTRRHVVRYDYNGHRVYRRTMRCR